MTQSNEITTVSKPFKYVSLFSGIGGFEQALNAMGGECVLASEIDKFANQSYEALYGHPTAGDITAIDAKDVPDHDLLVGGFPCQAFSVAGKRLGFEDTRGTLFFEVARLAREKQPKAVLLENVKGLVGHDKGRTLDVIVQTLNDIGYTVDFEVLNSKYFGVPQNRERIFIVAVRDDLVEAKPWNIEGNTVVPKGKRRISAYEGVKTFNFDWPTQDSVTTRLRDVLEAQVDEKYYLSDDKTAALVAQLNEGSQLGVDGKLGTLVNGANVSPNIDANYAKGLGPSDVAKNRNRRPMFTEEIGLPIREATKQGYAIAAEGDAVNFQFPDSKTRRGRVGKGIANTLEASSINQGVVERVEIEWLGDLKTQSTGKPRDYSDVYGVMGVDGVCQTLRTMQGGQREPKIAEPQEIANGDNLSYCLDANYTKDISPSSVNKGRRTHVEETRPRYRIRKLTPRECWRLQNFPDSAFDAVKAAGMSDSQMYKQAGNAVTVSVIKAIGLNLLYYLGED